MEKIGNSLIIVFLVAGFFTSAYNIPSVVAPHDCTATKCASSGGTWATSPDSCSSMGTTDMPTQAGTCNYPSPSPTTSYTCSDGPIPSSGCNCGSSGTSYSGYCCSNAWQSSACGTSSSSTTAYCAINSQANAPCTCGSDSASYAAGKYCCGSTSVSGTWSTSSCSTSSTACSNGPITGTCNCGGTSYSTTGYCCNNVYQPSTACTTTTSPSPGASPYYEPATCSSTNPWNCYTQADCTDTAKGKGVWCKSSNSYGGNCNSAGTTCPVCSSTQVWNCYTDTECKAAGGYWSLPTGGAGGSGWCSSTPNDKTSCTTANMNWCGTYCTSGTCPTCSSSQIWNCYEEPSCTTAGGVWCKSSSQAGGNCNTKPYTCPTCSFSQLWSCYDSASCTTAGGQWNTQYGSGNCEQKCSASNIWSCKDSASCTGAGGQWQNSYCSQKCSSANLGSCSETECKTVGGQWSNTYCQQPCSASNIWSCKDSASCTTAGGQWNTQYGSGNCEQKCSASNIWSCKDQTSCTGAGGQWNTQYGSGNCEQKCSASNIWSCKDQTSCTGAGGQWQNSYCSQKCSAAAPWTCTDKTSCESVKGVWTGTYCNTPQDQPGCTAAGLKWCTPQYTAAGGTGGGGGGWCSSSCPAYDKASCEASNQYWCGSATVSPADSGISSGWCSQSKCPECTAFNIYNCYDRESCEKVKGYWYKSMCNSLPAPKCEKGEPLYQCYEKTPCESANGEWCVGSQYGGSVAYYTPYSSQGYCTTKSTPSLCPKTCPSVKACLIDEIVEFDNDGCQKSCRKLSACPASFEPVCGSDYKTYPNECEAKAAGATPVKYKGSCTFTPPICDDKAYDPMQACRDQGKSYTFDEDKSGCPVPGTTKCTPFKHKCPIFATSAATVGFVSPRDGCITSGGEYEEETDSLGCGHPKCDHDKTLSRCKYVKHVEAASEVLECPDDYKYQGACPQFNQKELDFMKSECTKYGGTFATTVKGSCTYPDCKFTSGDFDFDNPLGKIEKCQTNLEIQKQSLACEALGGKALNSIVGRCKKLVCDREESKCTHEPALEQQTAELCKKEGKEAIKKFDSNGCAFSTCGKADECDKEAPATAAAKCASEGGEYVVNKAPNGCVEFADCIKPGLHADDVLFEPVKAVPDVLKLLDIALKLEELKIALDKLAVSSGDIAVYYESKGDKGDAEKYKRVSDMLVTAKDEVDKIKEKLKAKLDKITIDELTEVKKDLAVLKDSLLREVLFLILSTKSEAENVATTKVCGSNADCFDNAYRTCKPTTFTPPVSTGKSTPTVKIDGLQDDKCILTASLTDAGTSYSMNCAIENYALGMHGPEDLLPHCTGNMVDFIKSGYFDSKPAPEAPSTTKAPATGLIIRR